MELARIVIEVARSSRRAVCFLVLALLMARPAAAADDKINLAWDEVDDADVVGYLVYVGTASSTYTQTHDVGMLTSFTFTDAVPGQRYYFAVAGYTKATTGPKSHEVSGFSNAPPTLDAVRAQKTKAGAAVSLALLGRDPDGTRLIYDAANLPPGVSLAPATGVISGSPMTPGAYAVTASVTDGVLTAQQTFMWTVTGSAAGDTRLIAPNGAVGSRTPAFEWEAVEGVTEYRLLVEDARGKRHRKTFAAAALGCGSGTCTAGVGEMLPLGEGRWRVAAREAEGYGKWSLPLGFVVDTVKPEIDVTSPRSGVLLKKPQVVVKGIADDDVGLAEITWETQRGKNGTATTVGGKRWQAEIDLEPGVNRIVVTARDLAGNTRSQTIVIRVP